MLPLLCALIAVFLARGEKTLEIRAGVAVAPGDEFGAAVFEGLSRFESPFVFELYTLDDTAVLEEMVMTGEMECAYIISPEFLARMRNGRADGGVVRLISPRSVFHVLADETIFASVLWQTAPETNRGLLAGVLGLEPELAAEIVRESFAYYQEHDDIFLAPIYIYHGQEESGEAPASRGAGARLLHGVIALFLLAGGIWALPCFIKEKPALFPRLSRAGARRYLLGVGGAIFLMGMIQGALALAVIRALHPAALRGLPAELGWLAAYQLAVSMAGLAVLAILRRSDLIYGVGVFLLLLTAALGGVALDLAELGPAFAGVSRFFISSGYIDGALGGGLQNLIPLAAAVLGGAALALTLAGRAERRNNGANA